MNVFARLPNAHPRGPGSRSGVVMTDLPCRQTDRVMFSSGRLKEPPSSPRCLHRVGSTAVPLAEPITIQLGLTESGADGPRRSRRDHRSLV